MSSIKIKLPILIISFISFQLNCADIKGAKVEKQIDKFLEKFFSHDPKGHYLNKFKKEFAGLKNLKTNEIIKALNYLEANLKYIDAQEASILQQSNIIKSRIKKYSEDLKKIIGVAPGHFNYSTQKFKFEREKFIETYDNTELLYLLYKYLYLLLNETTIKENNIENPEQLKNSMLDEENIYKLKNL